MTFLSTVSDPGEGLLLRQLRHHTKNTLQRLLIEVASCDGLQRDAQGRGLAAELERRIGLSAVLSDALFGLTRSPGPMEERLRDMATAVVGLLGDADQCLRLEITAADDCPAALCDVVVQIAHEFVSNAVKHGMRLRMIGRIGVELRVTDGHVALMVRDDGWGCPDGFRRQGGARADAVRDGRIGGGEGLSIAGLLAQEHGGWWCLVRDGEWTVAEASLPVPYS